MVINTILYTITLTELKLTNMKTILLSLFTMIYSLGYSQYFIGYENLLGAKFEKKPIGSYVVDTILEYSPHKHVKSFALDSLSNFSNTDSINLGETNSQKPFYNDNVPVRLWFTGGSYGLNTLILDTNGVFFKNLDFDQSTNPKIDTLFFLSNHSIISAKVTNPSAGQFYYGSYELLYDTLVKIKVTSDLPTKDTVYIDNIGNQFYSLPLGYAPSDTNTYKIDSILSSRTCTSSNSGAGILQLQNVLPYQDYYCAFTLFSYHNSGASIRLALDTTNLYYDVPISSWGSPYRTNHVINDTVLLDSTSILTLRVCCGKNNGAGISTEYFKTETRISIKQVIGLDEILNEKEIIIYPNPVGSILYLQSKEMDGITYNIYNLSGNIVLNGKCITNQINMESISEGTYILFIPELGVSQKFVKQD